MKVNADININYGILDSIISRLPSLVSDIVSKTAYDCQEMAQNFAPVDTGYLKGSISVENESPTKSLVIASAEYASYVEYGTYKMAAQPFLMPAAEITGVGFRAALEGIVGNL